MSDSGALPETQQVTFEVTPLRINGKLYFRVRPFTDQLDPGMAHEVYRQIAINAIRAMSLTDGLERAMERVSKGVLLSRITEQF